MLIYNVTFMQKGVAIHRNPMFQEGHVVSFGE